VCDRYRVREERVVKLLLGLRACIVLLKVMSADVPAINMAAAAWPALGIAHVVWR